MDVVVADLRATYRTEDALPVVARGLADPADFLARLADAVDAYWRTCLAAYWWPRVQTILETDLAHQARVLAEQGAGALFSGLDPRLVWSDEHLSLTRPPDTAPPGLRMTSASQGAAWS